MKLDTLAKTLIDLRTYHKNVEADNMFMLKSIIKIVISD